MHLLNLSELRKFAIFNILEKKTITRSGFRTQHLLNGKLSLKLLHRRDYKRSV